MTGSGLPEWQKIEAGIVSAFKDVKLEDGIGYYEAGAMDDYLLPDSAEYKVAKAKDERDSWMSLLVEFKGLNLDSSRHCFMDAKGLRFYLPFWMIRRDITVNSILHFYISEQYKRDGYEYLGSRFTAMVELLTTEQKQCIYRFYDFMSKQEQSDFAEGYLNADFDTGEEKMKGFKFMDFVKEHFDSKSAADKS